MATTTQVRPAPENPYARLYAEFLEQTKDHVLTVHLDDGLNRQMRVGAPGTNVWSWGVTTWRGYLASFGDIADGFMFTRVEDMLDFFDCTGRQGYYSDNAPCIDVAYWAQKLTGRGTQDVRVFSEKSFLDSVRDQLRDHEECGDEAQAEFEADLAHGQVVAPQTSPAARGAEILADAKLNSDSEHDAMSWLSDREQIKVFGPDTWEWDIRDFDVHFVYACFALELTVRLWRAYEQTTEAITHRDPSRAYVLVEGGVVQNSPSLPVYDLDILDENDSSAASEEALDLYERIVKHPAAKATLPRAISDLASMIRDGGCAEDIEVLEEHEATNKEGVTA